MDAEVDGILLADDFAGNDGLGRTRALIDDQHYEVEDEGTYTLRFTGVIKCNSAATNQGFDVSVDLVIVGGCS